MQLGAIHLILMIAMTALFSIANRSAGNDRNIAAGCEYAFSDPPRYERCTDPGDAQQLTDGKYAPANSSGMWSELATVGWSTRQSIGITIDLKNESDISGVSFSTAAGQSGVTWPEAIYILVSDDGQNFELVGELVSLSERAHPAPVNGYTLHRFKTNQLRAHGRYIALVPVVQEYVFVDEIEVYGHPSDKSPDASGNETFDLNTFCTRWIPERATERAVKRRYESDLNAIHELLDSAKVETTDGQSILADLQALHQEVDKFSFVPTGDFTTILPIGDLGARIMQQQANLWRATGLQGLVVWQSNLWDMLHVVHLPGTTDDPALSVRLMGNEYRAASLNLSNATDESITVMVNSPDFRAALPDEFVSVQFSPWTDTERGIPVQSALLEVKSVEDSGGVVIPSGMTTQLWFTVYSRNVPAGKYVSQLQLRVNDVERTVPFTVEVSPIEFPERPALHVGGWDYVNAPNGVYDVTSENLNALLTHLQERYVDSPWADASVFPTGAYAADGSMAIPPDTTNYDRWRTLWPNARQLCVFAEVKEQFDGTSVGDPLFQKKVAAWMTFWADYVRANGVDPTRVVLLLVDEPQSEVQDKLILDWAKAIKAANTGMRIWEDPAHADYRQASREMLAACDVLCVRRTLSGPQADIAHYQQFQRNGAELAFYSCTGTPGNFTDPYSYFRLQAWACARYGAKSSFFWAFSDGGGASSWNGYATRRAFAPYYLDAKSVTPAKQMEAIREGTQDYEYLVMLKQAIEKARNDGGKTDLVRQADDLLKTAAERVDRSAEPRQNTDWDSKIDRTVADTVRLEVLDALEALAR